MNEPSMPGLHAIWCWLSGTCFTQTQCKNEGFIFTWSSTISMECCNKWLMINWMSAVIPNSLWQLIVAVMSQVSTANTGVNVVSFDADTLGYLSWPIPWGNWHLVATLGMRFDGEICMVKQVLLMSSLYITIGNVAWQPLLGVLSWTNVLSNL